MLILQAFAPEPPMLIPPILMPPPVLAAAAAVVAVPDLPIVEVPMAMELDPIFIFASSLKTVSVGYVDQILVSLQCRKNNNKAEKSDVWCKAKVRDEGECAQGVYTNNKVFSPSQTMCSNPAHRLFFA